MPTSNFLGQALGLKDEPEPSSQGEGILTQQCEHVQLEQCAWPQINHVPWPSQPLPTMMPMINNPNIPGNPPQKATVDKLGFVNFYRNSSSTLYICTNKMIFLVSAGRRGMKLAKFCSRIISPKNLHGVMLVLKQGNRHVLMGVKDAIGR